MAVWSLSMTVTLHEQIRTLLLAAPAVTAIVGAGTAARIRGDYFQKLDGTAAGLEAVLIEVDSQEEQNDLSGQSGLAVGQITLTCRAASRQAASDLAQAVRGRLAGYASPVLDLVLDSRSDAWTAKTDASEDGWYDSILTFTPIYAD